MLNKNHKKFYNLSDRLTDLECKLKQTIVTRCTTMPTKYVGKVVIFDGNFY